MASDICFLKEKKRREEEEEKEHGKPPEVAWLVDPGVGPAWACPALCFLMFSYPG